MKYYLHDTNSFDDEKITELYLKFGFEGLGLFYTALEKIAKQEKPVKTEVLKAQLNIKKRLNKCWNFIEEIGLISSINGESFNEKLLNYSEKYKIKKEKNRKKISEWRKNQNDIKSVTSYEQKCNPDKVKESKVKENKINGINERIENLKSEVYSFNNYEKELQDDFIRYWTEPNKSKTKMRCELEKTWDTKLRLITWENRSNKFNNKRNGNTTHDEIDRIFNEKTK